MMVQLDTDKMRQIAHGLSAIYPEDVSRLRDHNIRSYEKYRDDPVGYINRVLRKTLTPNQKAVCEAIMNSPHKVIAQSANNQGKTFLGGALVNWFYDTREQGVCLTTAPIDRDVKDGIWKQVRSLRKTRWDFRGDLIPELYDNERHYAKGFTSTIQEGYHGRHDPDMMFIIDEAVGVKEFVWRGFKSMFIPNGRHFFLAFLNPTDTTSQAYSETQNTDPMTAFKVVRMSALEHPNIDAALRGLPSPIPGAVDTYQLEVWFRDWFEEIDRRDERPGDVIWPPDWSIPYGSIERVGRGRQRCLRPNIDGQARVLGLWPIASEYAVWSELAWNAAIRKLDGLTPLDLLWESPPQIGVDVAFGGGDSTEVVVQCDFIALEHRAGKSWDLPRTMSELKMFAEKYAKLYNEHKSSSSDIIGPKNIPIKVDDDGVGGAVGQMLRNEGYNAIPVGAGCVSNMPDRYPLMRDQLWFEVVSAAKAGYLDLSRLPEQSLNEMRRQAMAIRFQPDHRGRRRVWYKDETRKMIGRSPDSMDALNLSLYNGGLATTPPQVLKK